MNQAALIEQIYEAAFIPERWTGLLETLAEASGSASSTMLVFDRRTSPRWRTTEISRPILEAFARTDIWRSHERSPDRLLEGPGEVEGFHCVNDLMSPEQLARDFVMGEFAKLGLAWQIGTAIPMPTDEIVVVTFERRIQDGRHDPARVAELVALRPHLARAGMIASRLGMERARGALDAMTALGMPAALIDQRGGLREANALMGASLVDTRAGGRVHLGDPTGDKALEAILSGESRARSIALKPTELRPGRVAHLMPLGGEARDLFTGAMSLLVMSVAGGPASQLDLNVLRALFDLSPAESRLAAALAGGADLNAAAAQNNIRVSTARSYLEQIFRKTGCHRQSELVALLVGLATSRAEAG
jgi:DNA-binding CsgD family transcriptional regulator